MIRTLTLALILAFSLAAFAEDAPKVETKPAGAKLDPAKYPQDTPEKALDSIAKAWGAEDFAYFVGWLVTPDSTARSIEKFKTFEAAVDDQKTNPQKIEGRKAMLASIQKILKDPKKEADKDEVDAVRFPVDEKSFLQFEKQKDGRWCWNPRARSK